MILTMCLIQQSVKHEEAMSDRHCVERVNHAKYASILFDRGYTL